MALSVTFFLGIFIMVGAVIARQAKNKALVEQLSISIAFGTMTALALTDLMPEAVENLGNDNMYVMYFGVAAGILVLKLLDRFIPDHDSVRGFDHQCTDANVIHIGIISSKEWLSTAYHRNPFIWAFWSVSAWASTMYPWVWSSIPLFPGKNAAGRLRCCLRRPCLPSSADC